MTLTCSGFLNLGPNLGTNLGTPPGLCCLVITVMVVCIEVRVVEPQVYCHIAGEALRKLVYQKKLRFRLFVPKWYLFIEEDGEDRREERNSGSLLSLNKQTFHFKYNISYFGNAVQYLDTRLNEMKNDRMQM